MPSDGGELGATFEPRQSDREPQEARAFPADRGLRSRLLTDVLDLARRPAGDRPALSLFDGAEWPSALKLWFGDTLATLPRKRSLILAALDRDIAEIDALLGRQINAILHAPAFQKLEAAWRGLKYVTDAAEGADDVLVRFLPVTWNELVRDFERAPDFDKSQLFIKLYDQEFDMAGGKPYGLIIGDYMVQHVRSAEHPTDDVTALKHLSEVAAAAFVPIVLGVSPAVFQVDSFREFGRPLDIRSVFRQTEYQRWNAMRDGQDMRFIGLALPRVLMRLPYTDDNARRDGFRFREEIEAPDGSGYLWGNAAFAFASVVLRAYANFGWFADIRGAPRDELRGGLVIDLPVPWFSTDKPKVAVKPSTECVISDDHEKTLGELGFIALRKAPLTAFSVFNETPSMQLPVRYDKASATANARLSTMLQYMLCVSRFAHFIKIIGRDLVGSVKTAEECQELIQSWLTGYCVGSDNVTAEVKARYPLREAQVEVKDVAGRPGSYACAIHLRPHFQLDDIAATFRLVTELAPPRN